jgi:hypothetical protein
VRSKERSVETRERESYRGLVFRDRAMAPGARQSLRWAVAGLFFCGFLLGFVAIAKAGHALDMTTMNPGEYVGDRTASAAMVLGAVDVVVWAFAIMGLALV